jgi:hypothetical protein
MWEPCPDNDYTNWRVHEATEREREKEDKSLRKYSPSFVIEYQDHRTEKLFSLPSFVYLA